jgi:hypothetical protein
VTSWGSQIQLRFRSIGRRQNQLPGPRSQNKLREIQERSSMGKASKWDEPLDDGPLVTEYCGPRNLRALAADVINQAVRDIIGINTPVTRQIDAFLFITSDLDFEAWKDWAGTPHYDPYSYLLPNLQEVKRQLRRQ